MSSTSYVSKISCTCEHLGLACDKYKHIGRVIAPALMDFHECEELSKRNVGNWATDVYGTSYCTKLPLSAMRALAGFNVQRGFHVNKRSTFFGDNYHKDLPKMIFPWIEDAMDKISSKFNPTAIGFLTLLKNLRWVIIQDCAVLIGVHNREHILFKDMNEIFKSKMFIDYTYKMKVYLKNDVEMNIHSSMISSILPDIKCYVKENTKAIIKTDKSIKKIGIDMNQHFKEFSNISIKEVIHASMLEFCNHIGNFNPESKVIPTKGNRVMNKANEENDCVPKKIDTFSDMREYVEARKDCKMSLNTADKKRIQRMKYIVKKYKSMLLNDNELNLMSIFESLHDQSKCKLGPFHKKCREL